MPRRLRPEEEALWRRVAERTTPLHRDRPAVRRTAASDASAFPAPAKAPEPRLHPFRIGEAAASDQSAQPAIAAQPVRVDRRLQKALSRGKRSPEASIDLHGMTVAEAHPALTRFILASFATGRRLVLVVTGKGRSGNGDWLDAKGVLRRQVPDWLTGPPLGNFVQEILPAHRSHGGAGALYVILRRN